MRLSTDVVTALTFWPDYRPRPHEPVDLTVLPPFFTDLLGDLPWWNPAWRITEVRPARPCFARVAPSDFSEVAVPGSAAADDAGPLPFAARVRFQDTELLWFQAKIGNTVIGPGTTPPGEPEPDPAAAVIRAVMDVRRVSTRALARQCFLSESTIRALRHGWSPDPTVVERLAAALDIPLEYLRHHRS
ncbi:helix-turn-helix transcriptional regulator [Asanoa sp. NPDC049573]|uniref:helix-turn-helix domain-containing protein n=1 Tax=Asanoa sp. NPDC049573 TaxID=3155396 RepID=UPI003448178E